MVVPRLVSVIVALLLSSSALVLNGPPAHASQRPVSENEKIEALIKHIEGLADAKFVRNGSEYDAKTAAKFLRRKWESKKDEIKTAQDFIDKAASVSSTSGKPYLIRKDGKDTKSGEYLMEQLKKLGE